MRIRRILKKRVMETEEEKEQTRKRENRENKRERMRGCWVREKPGEEIV